MRVLIAAARPPAANGKGYQVRLFNQILQLAGTHDITLLALAHKGEEIEPQMVRACRVARLIERSRAIGPVLALAQTPRLPWSVGLYRDPRMRLAIRESLRTGRFDLLHLQLVRMGTYLREGPQIPVLLDLMDAAALNMRERAATAPLGMRQLLQLEARRLAQLELRLIEEADLSLLISERDRASVGSPRKTRVNPNGIDPPPDMSNAVTRAKSTVILTGTMSYFANSDAAAWFTASILPLVKLRIPDVQFRIVGRDPGRAVTSLSTAGVIVTGAVANIANELRRAAVAVCPIRLGSGLSTKVLEAMATGTPVIATSKAVQGLPSSLARYALIADDAGTFADAVVRSLQDSGPALDRASLGLAEIRRSHTWRHSVDELEASYEEAITSHGIRNPVAS